jgi:hypothetical protein
VYCRVGAALSFTGDGHTRAAWPHKKERRGAGVSWTAEQLQVAERLDAEVRRLVPDGHDDIGVFAAMADRMPEFMRLLDAGLVNELYSSGAFPGVLRYAKILGTLRHGIRDGRIRVAD